jgi:hypothetical protein
VCKERLAEFGTFVVEIKQPLRLLERICDAWRSDGRSSSDAFITPVLYNKDALVFSPPYFIAPPSLAYAQKPASYSHEGEYRYVLCCKVGTTEDPFLTLRAGPCHDVCSLISPP